MLLGLACAAGAALCYGVGSVLQAVAAGDADAARRLDPRLVLRLLGAWRYVVGLALDAVGFVLSLVALRSLPLYVVQSVVASSLAVAAVAGALVLGTRLRNVEWVALGVVVAGLALVSLSAAPESPQVPGPGLGWLLLGGTVVLGAVAVPMGGSSGPSGASLLGGVAGLAFGVVAIGARTLSASTAPGRLVPPLHVLVAAPATYALLCAAPLALVAYATALQRGSVVEATAPLVVGETVLPALVGLALLGDHARSGWGPAGATGFVLAVGGAVVLSRFGEVPTVEAERPTAQ